MRIREQIIGLDDKAKFNIKAGEILKINLKKKYKDKNTGIDIEIISQAKIEGGIEIFAKATKNGLPLGFGKDGKIETERFRFINPPIMVDDNVFGTIDLTSIDIYSGKVNVRKIKEAPEQAIQESLAHTIKVVGKENTNPVAGSIGSTTTTVYASAGDGDITYNTPELTTTDWSVIRATTVDPPSAIRVTGTTSYYAYYNNRSGTNYKDISRGFLPFDTSAIGSDTVSSATLSFWIDTILNSLAGELCIVQTTQASLTTLVVTDFQLMTLNTPDEGITRAAFSGLSTGAYTNIALNANGISWIGATTKLAERSNLDVDNSAPTGSDVGGYLLQRTSEYAGTASDPKLVIEHAPGVAAGANNLSLLGVT